MEPTLPGDTGSMLIDGDTKREEGATYLRQGRFAEAANALGEATEINPTDEGAWRLLGGAFASQGDYSRAAAAFEQAIVLAPGNARNNYNLGLALEALDRSSEARAAFEQALSIDPTYEAARTHLSAIEGGASETYAATASAAAAMPPLMPMESLPPTEQDPTLTSLSSASDLDRPTYESEPPQPLSSIGFASESAISAFPATDTGFAPQPVLGQGYDVSPNNSGMRAGAPPEVAGGWNWGAFLFSWIWLINHKLVGWGVGLLLVSFVPYLGGLVSLAAVIYLGIKGNELGWSNRRFQSVEDFKACQRIWAKWALWYFLVSIAIGLVVGVIVGIVAATGSHSR